MSRHLSGQPRRWITPAGLSPVALAPRGPSDDFPEYYTVMSFFAQTPGSARQRLALGGALMGGALQ
jgi:hypothetical protein